MKKSYICEDCFTLFMAFCIQYCKVQVSQVLYCAIRKSYNLLQLFFYLQTLNQLMMDHSGQGLGNIQLEQDWKDVLSLPFFIFKEDKQEQWNKIIRINLKQFVSYQQDVDFEEQYHYLYSSNGDYFSFNDISNNTIYVIQIQTQKQKLKIKYQESSQVDIQFSNDSQYFIWMEDGQANIMNLINNEKDFSILYDARVELDIMISYCYLYAASVIIDKKENQTCIFDIKIYQLNTKILIKQFQFRPDYWITIYHLDFKDNIIIYTLPFSKSTYLSIGMFQKNSYFDKVNFSFLRTSQNCKILQKIPSYKIISNFFGIDETQFNHFKIYNVFKGKLIKNITYLRQEMNVCTWESQAFKKNNDLIIQTYIQKTKDILEGIKINLLQIYCFQSCFSLTDGSSDQKISSQIKVKMFKDGKLDFYYQ